MKKPKFLRRTWSRFSKLGRGRKKKQKWRRPTGRDNKMREKRKGYPIIVSIGYKQDAKVRGEIQNKKPVLIYNITDLQKIGKNQIGIIRKVGKKKKIEIAKAAKGKKILIQNLNTDKFLKKIEKVGSKKLEGKPKTKKVIKKDKKNLREEK